MMTNLKYFLLLHLLSLGAVLGDEHDHRYEVSADKTGQRPPRRSLFPVLEISDLVCWQNEEPYDMVVSTNTWTFLQFVIYFNR